MSNPYNLTIQDVGTAYFAPDTTPAYVSQQFNDQINELINAYNTYIQDSSSGTSPSDATLAGLYSTIYNARQALIDMAKNGIQLPAVVGQTPTVGYLNQQMAESLDTVLKTLDIAGINQDPTALTAQYGTTNAQGMMANAVNSWMGLSTAGLATYLSEASVAATTGSSIQAMIDLEYVQAGNQLINQQLSGLESALNYTQSAVNILNILQQIQNAASTGPATYQDTSRSNTYTLNPALPASQLSTPSARAGGALTLDGSTASNYVATFGTYGGSAFNSPLPVISKASGAQLKQFEALSTASGALYHLVSELLPQYGLSGTTVYQTFGLATGSAYIPSGLNGTLAGSLFQVYFDMNHNAGGSITNWITDHQGAGSDYNIALQGNYSVNLTTAQTSAESLNSQQSQQVQQTLFLFQEFYQSGSGMLTQINQIIQAMAQQIGQ